MQKRDLAHRQPFFFTFFFPGTINHHADRLPPKARANQSERKRHSSSTEYATTSLAVLERQKKKNFSMFSTSRCFLRTADRGANHPEIISNHKRTSDGQIVFTIMEDWLSRLTISSTVQHGRFSGQRFFSTK